MKGQIIIQKFLLPTIIVSLMLSFGISQQLPPLLESKKYLEAESAAVSCAHPLAAQIGVDIIKAGGNAVDAAIAVQLALAVVYPRAGNLGGGGFMVIRDTEGRAHSLDFREMAPGLSTENMYLNEEGKIINNLSLTGIMASGVPGTVAGMIEAHQRFGNLDINMLIEPAYRLAEGGFMIGVEEANRLNEFKNEFDRINNFDHAFKKSKWKKGDILIQKELANTLKLLMDNGLDDFYSGTIASKIVSEVSKRKGIITAEDLRNYKAVWRAPLIVQYKNHEIITMPPPSSGGIAIGQILLMLSNYEFVGKNHFDPEVIHHKVEAERRAFADRSKFLGDPDFTVVPTDSLLSGLANYTNFSSINPQKASGSDEFRDKKSKLFKESFETTHFSIVDNKGMAVSVTTTLNSNFGSKVILENSGFFLNNEMDDFVVKPGEPNQFGLLGSEANKIEPGKRMLSSMTPTIVTKDGNLFLVLGTPGGSTIITTVYQIISNIIDHNMELREAVTTKRYHHQWFPDMIMYEKGCFDKKVIRALKSKGHQLQRVDRIGLVDAIQISDNGKIIAVADGRAEDAVEGY